MIKIAIFLENTAIFACSQHPAVAYDFFCLIVDGIHLPYPLHLISGL